LQKCLVIFGLLRDDFYVDQVAVLLVVLEIFPVYIHLGIIVHVRFVLVLDLVSDVKGFLGNNFFQAKSGFLLILVDLRKLETRKL
jgi:hypothetical protein